jgi:hypothetical protein
MPSRNAFCRSAPGVRFIALEILTTGVLAFECALRLRKSSFVQGLLMRRFALFAMFVPLIRQDACSTSRRPLRDAGYACLFIPKQILHVSLME